jgi:hypothetical protein
MLGSKPYFCYLKEVLPEKYCFEMEYLQLRFTANIVHVDERGIIPANVDTIQREKSDNIRWSTTQTAR